MPAKSSPHSYPYSIPPVDCPDPEDLKKLDPWDVLEFFRIEALLRSQRVMKLYKQSYASWNKKDLHTDELLTTYGVWGGWQVLEGTHHYFLFPGMVERFTHEAADKSGIVDLRELLISPVISKDDVMPWLRQAILRKDRRYLWVRIDCACPPHTTLLKPSDGTRRSIRPVPGSVTGTGSGF